MATPAAAHHHSEESRLLRVPQPIRIATDSRRFFVLGVFCAFGLGNQFQSIGNANIAHELTEYLGCSTFQVNMLVTVFLVVYVLGAFPGCVVVHDIGLRRAMLLGQCVDALGAVLKLIAVTATRSYWLLFTGQLLAAVGQVFFQGLPPLVAATWFPVSERSTATACGMLAIFLGFALGFSVPPALVNSSRQSEADFGLLYGLQAAFCIISCICGVVVPTQPEHPPSVTSPLYSVVKSMEFPHAGRTRPDSLSETAVEQREQTAVDSRSAAAHTDDLSDIERAAPDHVLQQLWEQRHNTSFVWVVLGNGLAGGLTNAIAPVLAQLMQPFGVSEAASGKALLAAFLTGGATTIVIAAVVDKYRQYKKLLLGFYAAALLTLTTWVLLLAYVSGNGDTFQPIAMIGTVFLVASLLSTLTISMELSVELTYPMPEVISGTAIMWVVSAVAAVGIVIISAIVGDSASRKDTVDILAASCLVAFGIVFVTVLFVKEDLRRWDAERGEHHHQLGASAATTDHHREHPAGAEGHDRDVELRPCS